MTTLTYWRKQAHYKEKHESFLVATKETGMKVNSKKTK